MFNMKMNPKKTHEILTILILLDVITVEFILFNSTSSWNVHMYKEVFYVNLTYI